MHTQAVADFGSFLASWWISSWSQICRVRSLILKHVVNQIMGELASARNGPSVYVGDSVTDVLALLRADVGIIVGKSRTLRKVPFPETALIS